MIPRKVTRTNHGVACCVCSRVLDIGERLHREREKKHGAAYWYGPLTPPTGGP